MSLLSENFNGSLMPVDWNYLDMDDSATSTAGHAGNAARVGNSQGNYGGWVSPDFAATVALTVDVWVRMDFFMYGSSGPILELRNGSTKMLGIRINSSGNFELYQYSGPTPSYITAGATAFTENTWLHVVLEADVAGPGTATLTVNGSIEIAAAMGMFANGATGATNLVLGTIPYTATDFDDLDVSAGGGGGGGGGTVRFTTGVLRGVCRGLFW